MSLAQEHTRILRTGRVFIDTIREAKDEAELRYKVTIDLKPEIAARYAQAIMHLDQILELWSDG